MKKTDQHRSPTTNSALPRVTACIIMLLLTTLPTLATLQWETKKISIKASLGDTEARTTFAYRNAGQEPVTIQSVRSDCGCTAAIADDPTVQPGEAGEIDMLFTFGDRIGLQRITTRVRTDSPEDPETTLVLNVDIPTAITATPRAIVWRLSDTPLPVKITVHPSIKVKSLKSDSPSELTAEITPETKQNKSNVFRLQFYPSQNLKPGRFSVPITLLSEDDNGEIIQYSTTVRLLARPASTPSAAK